MKKIYKVNNKSKRKKFTLIELIIVIIVIGILIGMSLPKFLGVVRNANVSAMYKDIEALEVAIPMYFQKNDDLPIYELSEKTFVVSETLKDTINKKNDDISKLRVIKKNDLKNYLNNDTKYGKEIKNNDEYLYSLLTGNVYYCSGLENGNNIVSHTYESKGFDVSDNESNIVQKPFIKLLGGSLKDEFRDVKETKDGGYISVGYTVSINGDFNKSKGNTDCLIAKFDNNGEMEWNQVLGGDKYEDFYSVEVTNDGGYIACGYTNSLNGDLNVSKNGADVLIVRFDKEGKMIWNKVLGGTGYDRAYSIEKTLDNCYIIAGQTASSNGDFKATKGVEDTLLIKMDDNGVVLWNSVLGGSGLDTLLDVKSTTDGGYIIVGKTNSTNGSFKSSKGLEDTLIVKLNSLGEIEWNQVLGGSGIDEFKFVIEDKNTYVAVGRTESKNGDFNSSKGGSDALIVKYDTNGNVIWHKTYGGLGYDDFSCIRKTKDNGYIIVGSTNSNNGDFYSKYGVDDALIVKINESGEMEWNKVLGGSSLDYFIKMAETMDKGYIVAGHSKSSNGDFGVTKGDYDALLIKFDSLGNLLE